MNDYSQTFIVQDVLGVSNITLETGAKDIDVRETANILSSTKYFPNEVSILL